MAFVGLALGLLGLAVVGGVLRGRFRTIRKIDEEQGSQIHHLQHLLKDALVRAKVPGAIAIDPGPNFSAPPMMLDAYPPEPADDYEATEAALFETLQAAEYRMPYKPELRWPLYEEIRKPTMRAVTEQITNANGETRLMVVDWEPIEPEEITVKSMDGTVQRIFHHYR